MITIHTPKGEEVTSVPSSREVRRELRNLPPGGYTVHDEGKRIASAIVISRILFGNPVVTTMVTPEK